MPPHIHTPSPLPQGVWRASQQRLTAVAALSSGFPALDAVLPGQGWPLGMLTELLSPETGIGELRLLTPLLQRISAQHQSILLIDPPHLPYPPGLSACGIHLPALILIQTQSRRDRLWALEQSLRCGCFGAVLAWLPEPTRHTELRRMQVAAHEAPGPVFIFRPTSVQDQASPAPLRIRVHPQGRLQIALHILKRRGPVLPHPVLLPLHCAATGPTEVGNRPSAIKLAAPAQTTLVEA